MIHDTLLGPAFPEHGWVPAPRYLMRRARVLQLMRGLPPGAVLEVGPGAGTLLAEFAARGFTCQALELSREARELAANVAAGSGHALSLHDQPDPAWRGRFDYVFAFDVLEHIDDDVAALAQWVSWLKPGGRLLLSVPAHAESWTAGDEWAGHVRRYERDGLEGQMHDAGLEVEAFECYGFPLTNLSERVSASSYRKQIHAAADSSAGNRRKNNDRSGIDRQLHLRLFPLLSSWPGKLAMRGFFSLQKLFLRTDLGSGYILKAHATPDRRADTQSRCQEPPTSASKVRTDAYRPGGGRHDMKRVYRTIGLVIGVIATATFAWYAARSLDGQDLARYMSVRSLLAITIAALFYASIIPVSAWAWGRLLHGMDVNRSWRELVEIMAITQLAKYVPGNVGVHLGRAGMALAKGIGSRPLVVSMLLEVVLAVVAALAVGLAGIALSSSSSTALTGELRASLWIACAVLALVVLVLVLLRLLAAPLLRRFAPRHAGLLASDTLPGAPIIVRALAAYALNYVFIGIGLATMAYVVLPYMAHDAALLCASFALAWVAGFFTPGAPAGLGVREGLMLIILGVAYASADALFIVIGFRLATMLGDALMFVTGYGLLLHSRRRAAVVSIQ